MILRYIECLDVVMGHDPTITEHMGRQISNKEVSPRARVSPRAGAQFHGFLHMKYTRGYTWIHREFDSDLDRAFPMYHIHDYDQNWT